LGGGSCERTEPNAESTTNFAWQQGHVTCKFSSALLLMEPFYAFFL
jgi:hypothetical protein